MSVRSRCKSAHLAALTLLATAAGVIPQAVAGPPAGPPPVMSILPDDRTLAVLGADDLVKVAGDLHALVGPVAGPQLDRDPETLWIELVDRIGFAPGTAEGWRSLGVDPAAGVSLVVDMSPESGAVPMPIVLLRITDLDRLAEGLTARGLKTAFEAPDADGLRIGRMGDRSVALTEKQGWHAVAVAFDAPGARSRFTAWSKAPGGLSESRIARPLVRPGAGWIYAAVELARLRGWPQFAAVVRVLDGVTFTGGLDLSGGRIRLLTNGHGQAVLGRIFAPPKTPRPLARYVEPQRMRIALALAPSTVLAGLTDLLPPEMARQQAAIRQAQAIAESILEGSITQLDALLTGQVVILGADDGGDDITGLILGLRDIEAVRTRIERITGLAERDGLALPEQVVVEGHSAYRIQRYGQTLLAVFTDDALLFGQAATIAAALERAAGVGPDAQRPLLAEGEVAVLGMTRAGITRGFDRAKLDRAEAGGHDRFWRARFPDGIRLAVRLDDDGLVIEGPEAAVAGLMMFSGVAVVAAIEHMEQAKARAEAAKAQ